MPKTIVITGAGSGLGKHLAQRFAADGDDVVLLGRTLSKLQAVAAPLGERAMAVACDISSAESVTAAFQQISARHPKVDVLINNAVVIEIDEFADYSDEQIWQTVNTNLTGAMFCSRAALALMGRGGHIINVSSESVEAPYPHHVPYQATKAGIERMSHFLQLELEAQGIRITVVRAGAMADKVGLDSHADLVVAQNYQDFFVACQERGLDLAKRPTSDLRSCTDIFRFVVDLPQDVQITNLNYQARFPD
jgi:NAD(P)-dependent dehydrogenase (short-subunit alcohol dehydrogenase family)